MARGERAIRTIGGAGWAAALSAVCGLATASLAQDALGDGRALDGSLSTQTRYNAQRVDPSAEYRFRNAIATGNAPGGLSLRADVGYRSPYEFRGELGSDDLFSFRRDSLYSGLAGMGIRGTDAVQYQFALTTGSRLPENVVGTGFVSRDASRAERQYSGGISPEATVRAPTLDERLESERLTGLLRSTSTYVTTRPMRPVFLGNIANMAGEVESMAVSGSSLRGIRITGLDGGRSEDGSGAGDEDRAGGSALAESQRLTTAYDRVLESVREKSRVDRSAAQEADASAGVEDWEDRLRILREQLLLGRTEQAQQRPGAMGEEGEGEEGEAERELPPAPPEGGAPRGMRFDPVTLELLRPDGAPVDRLVEEGSVVDSVYIGHMEAGQELLGQGRYFDAEERFTKAIDIRPGDVAAQVGRLHAQLGAGLFVSAGLNLRALVMDSPEIAATRFAPGLLPGEQRAEEVTRLLRERAGLADERIIEDIMLQRETALLLAYLRYQRNERGIGVALDAAETTLSEEEVASNGGDVRLIAFLRQLWLEGEEGADTGGGDEGGGVDGG
ncbi:MAG: hypothetical protein ACF8Q5_09415 [Phycisphaerales bacterium JB040]